MGTKGENLVQHEDEIFSRPVKTWFQTSAQKKALKDQCRELHTESVEDRRNRKKEEKKKRLKDPFAGLTRKKKRQKMEMMDMKRAAEEALEEGYEGYTMAQEESYYTRISKREKY